jgi:hypothetical protein
MVSFKTYNPIKPVKSGLKMSVLSESTSGYICNFKAYIAKAQVVPLHAREALGGRGGTAPTHS